MVSKRKNCRKVGGRVAENTCGSICFCWGSFFHKSNVGCGYNDYVVIIGVKKKIIILHVKSTT